MINRAINVNRSFLRVKPARFGLSRYHLLNYAHVFKVHVHAVHAAISHQTTLMSSYLFSF